MGLEVKTESQIRDASKLIGMLSASLAELTDKKVPTFGEFTQGWLKEQMDSHAHRESTKKAKEYQVRRNLIPAFGQIPLDRFGNADWNAWVKLTKENPKDWRITRYFNARKTVNEILNAAKERGILERKPKLDNPDAHKKVGRVLTDLEVWWILRNTTYRIFRLFFYTMYKQGFRPREILRWERSMLKTADNGSLWIDVPARITKTKRARLAPINATVAKHILRTLKENPNARFVFENRIHPDRPQLSYHGAWKTACAKVGAKHPEFKKAVPYDFRRTFITRAMVRGAQPVFVAKHLDTSVPMLQNVYTKDDAPTMEALVR
jgi:hypothetical protein